jgi:hypothetical protein
VSARSIGLRSTASSPSGRRSSSASART